MKKTTAKKSIFSSISRLAFALMFISSWAILGVAIAIKSAKVEIGGNINFIATNIYASITGTVSGTKTENNLNAINFDANTTSVPEHSSWANMTLDFATSSDIIITINITNLSTERSLIASVIDSTRTENLLTSKKMKNTSSEELTQVSVFGTTTIAPTETQTMELTLHIEDSNKSVNTNLDMSIFLNDATPANEEDIAYTLVDGKAQISAYTGSNETFVIPETINGYPTTLAEGSSSGAGVTLPATTTSIVIPGTIETISNYAFFKNKTLENVIIEEGVSEIGEGAFAVTNFETISIPSSVKSIGDVVFQQSNLKFINLAEGLETIGNCAFRRTNLQEVNIPGSVKTIIIGAFYECSALENIIINEGVEAIEQLGFGSCSSLTSVKLPNSLKSMGNGIFQNCSALTSIDIPDSVETIGVSVFTGCSALTSVHLPNTLEEISNYVFSRCSSLTSIDLPNSLKSIGIGAFQACSSLTSIDIPDNVEAIEKGAFNQCTALTSISLPNSLNSIGVAAFQACTSLKNIDIPDSVEFIGDFAFNHCFGLENTTIKIPSNIKQIGGTEYIQLDTTNSNLDTQAEVDEARRAVIGTHVFYNCATDYLTAFSLDSSNENYMVVDGVLYTKNSAGNPEVLVAYPPKKVQPNNTYTMPDTVKDAYECSISRTYNLDKIILSDSFEIKEMALNTSDGYGLNGDWANNLLGMMYLFTSANIEVKSTNTRYYSENGAIYGKDGTAYANTLFYMPIYASSEGQTFTIKDGTTTIFNGAIPHNTVSSLNSPNGTVYKYTKIYIPVSVTSIGEKSLNVMNGVKDYKDKISSYTIEIDSPNTAYTVTDGKIVAK